MKLGTDKWKVGCMYLVVLGFRWNIHQRIVNILTICVSSIHDSIFEILPISVMLDKWCPNYLMIVTWAPCCDHSHYYLQSVCSSCSRSQSLICWIRCIRCLLQCWKIWFQLCPFARWWCVSVHWQSPLWPSWFLPPESRHLFVRWSRFLFSSPRLWWCWTCWGWGWQDWTWSCRLVPSSH